MSKSQAGLFGIRPRHVAPTWFDSLQGHMRISVRSCRCAFRASRPALAVATLSEESVIWSSASDLRQWLDGQLQQALLGFPAAALSIAGLLAIR